MSNGLLDYQLPLLESISNLLTFSLLYSKKQKQKHNQMLSKAEGQGLHCLSPSTMLMSCPSLTVFLLPLH